MLKKSTLLIITLTLTLTFTTSIFAAPTKQSLTKQKNQIDVQQNTLNQSLEKSKISFEDAQKEIESINAQIESLDFKIEGLTANITDSNEKIAAKVLEIKEAEIKLAKNLADLVEEQDLYNARMRTMYIEGPVQDIKLLLASKSLSDFFENLDAVRYLTELDKQITEDLANTKQIITETKATLETQNALLVTANNDLQNKLTQLKTSKSEQSTLITQAKSRQALYASQIAGYQSKMDEVNKQELETLSQLTALAVAQKAIDDADAAADAAAKIEADKVKGQGQESSSKAPENPIVPSSGSSTKGNAIISYAYKFIGTTYVWGGTQPSPGFDCSGYLQYVYAHFGIQISRTTYTQINKGTSVSRNGLQIGDLIFFGTYSDPHHVGMYVGNNCYIHAPKTGDVIKVSSLSGRSDFLCARRILN